MLRILKSNANLLVLLILTATHILQLYVMNKERGKKGNSPSPSNYITLD